MIINYNGTHYDLEKQSDLILDLLEECLKFCIEYSDNDAEAALAARDYRELKLEQEKRLLVYKQN